MKKRIAVSAVFTIMLIIISVQCSLAQTSFGIRGGINFQNVNGKDADGNKLDNSLKTGFNIGANAEIPVAPDYYVQPGLLFSTKGAKNGSTTLNISYLEIPVNFLYKPMLGAGKLLLGLGPYVAFGVGGQVKDGGNKASINFKNRVTLAEYTNGTPYFKRLDAGANFLAGYEFSNHVSLQLNAQLGLVKINPSVEGMSGDKSSWKNTGFGISAGYRF